MTEEDLVQIFRFLKSNGIKYCIHHVHLKMYAYSGLMNALFALEPFANRFHGLSAADQLPFAVVGYDYLIPANITLIFLSNFCHETTSSQLSSLNNFIQLLTLMLLSRRCLSQLCMPDIFSLQPGHMP
jgi:hypothetical protein